jgi:hypothetical protein
VSVGPRDDAPFSEAANAIPATVPIASRPGSTRSAAGDAGGPCQPFIPAQSPPSGWMVGWSLHH